MSRIQYRSGRMVLITGGDDVPGDFQAFINNCDDPDLKESVRLLSFTGSGLHVIDEKPAEDEIEPLYLSNRMNTFRITRSGRFRTADLVEHQIAHGRGEKALEERKAEAISFEEFEVVICTGCRQEPIEGDPCHCVQDHEVRLKDAEMELADYISQGEKIPSWLEERLAREAPVIRRVKYTRLIDPCVLERGTWLRDNLKTEITL